MVLLERVQHSLQTNNENFRSTLQHFASNGDVEAVTSLLENHPEIDVDIHSSKSRSTPLMAALIQNQQGFIIDYLIEKGADVNAFSAKGFNPIILAIKHCRNGTHALEKLIDAGASLKRFEKGRFISLTLLDIARQFKNEDAIEVLKKNGCVEGITATVNNMNYSRDNEKDDQLSNKTKKIMNNTNNVQTSANPDSNEYCTLITNDSLQNPPNKEIRSQRKPRKAMCPCCNCIVKFPTRMSFLTFNQEQAEKEYHQIVKQELPSVKGNVQVESGTIIQSSTKLSVKNSKGGEIYITRTYLDQFMNHNNGEAYQELCKIEYHGVGNMHKLRKEISESYSILHAVQECWMTLKGMKKEEQTLNEINFKNVYLVDLCSGKSMTAALCAVLFPQENNNRVLAVDKLPSHMVPHYFHEGNITYLSRDIMTAIFYRELEEAINRQAEKEGRTVILVGMHLCGNLSERAIEFFNKIQGICAIILSPCCLPKLRTRNKEKGTFSPSTDLNEEEKYMAWSNHLKAKIEDNSMLNALDTISNYNDVEMHSTKNSIISATRNSSQPI